MDVTAGAKLIREDDEAVYGESGYLGIQKRPEVWDDVHLVRIGCRINRRLYSFPRVYDNAIDRKCLIEYRKYSVRCKLEHIFALSNTNKERSKKNDKDC